MAEDTMAQEVEVAPQENNGAPAEKPAIDFNDPSRYVYDDALLIKVKGRVKRPAKPDTAERDLKVERLQAEIAKQDARIKEIKRIVEERRAARGTAQGANQEIIKRLQGLRNEFQTVLRQKQHIREEMQHINTQRDVYRDQVRKMRENRLLRTLTIETLATKINELEYKLAHEPGADKNLEKQIEELNGLRPKLRELADIEHKLAKTDESRKSVQQRLADCDAILQNIKTQEEAERATLDERKAAQGGNEVDVPTLNAEKQECWEIIKALRDKINEIRNEFQAKWTEFVKLDRNYQAYMRHQKHQEYLDRQKAREERAAAAAEENGEEAPEGAPVKEAKEDAVVVEPFSAEIFTLDQLVIHLNKLQPTTDAKAGAVQEEKKAVEVPQGCKPLKKKDEDLENLFAVSKKKPQQGKKGAAAAAPAEPAPKKEEPAKKKLNHTLETLKTFMQFGIEVPQTTAELAATVAKVEAKKVEFLEKRKKAKEAPAPKAKAASKAEEAAPAPPAEEASTSAAAPAPEPEAPAANGSSAEEAKPAEAEAAPAPAAAEGGKKKKKGGKKDEAAAEAAPAPEAEKPAEEAAPAPAPAKEEAAAPAADGVGVSLSVDSASQSVSMTLRVSEAGSS